MSWASSQYDENPFSENNPINKPSQSTNQSGKVAVNSNTMNVKADGPSWLQEAPAVNNQSQSQNVNADIPATAEGDTSIPRMILYTRVINLILSVCMIIVSLLSVLTTQSATTGVLACYLVAFSCLLCCFETHLTQVSKIIALNFGFMYSARARVVFMLFMGTILFSFSLFGKIIGVCMLVNAGFNAYILFKYPGYEAFQRNDAQSDIKDFLSTNPAFAQQFVNAGAEIIKSNPGLARQGAEAMFKSATAGNNNNQQQQQQQQQRNTSSAAGYSQLDSDANYASV